MKTLPLTKGRVAMVDDEDFPAVAQFRWYVSTHGYAVRTVHANGRSTKVSLHRFLMKPQGGEHIDHINGDPLDCRRANMRIATRSQNLANARKRITSTQPFKGITYDATRRRLRWYARVNKDGRRFRSKRFETAEEAARAHDDLARQLHGDFARLNFPRIGEQGAI
jgi:hypothetical protein